MRNPTRRRTNPRLTDHACRIMESSECQPDQVRYVRSGKADLIVCRPKGMSRTRLQSIRYPIEIWDEVSARESCARRGGAFEPAHRSYTGRPLMETFGGVQFFIEHECEYSCEGKQTKRGFHVYCRKVDVKCKPSRYSTPLKPYQMTKDEFVHAASIRKVDYGKGHPNTHDADVIYPGGAIRVSSKGKQRKLDAHWVLIKGAIEDGLKIPQRVLNEYPEFA